MMVFCEDCGGKNSIDPDRVTTDILEFRCQACNYLNRIHRPQTKTDTVEAKISKKRNERHSEKEISKILDELASTKGLSGAFIFHSDRRILSKSLPSGLDLKKLYGIANKLQQNYRIGQSCFKDVVRASLCFTKVAVEMNKITEEVALVVVRSPHGGPDRMEESIELVIEKLRSHFLH